MSLWFYPASAGGSNTIAVPAGSLILTGFAPTVVFSNNQTISVPAGSLTLTGFVPTVAVSDHKTIPVPAGSLSLAGQVPTVVVSDHKTITVPTGSLTLAGFAPTIAQTGGNVIAVDAGFLILAGYPPTIIGGISTPDVAAGGGRGARRRRAYVEIDGELFPVSDADEAAELLQKAREVAVEAAQVAVKTKPKQAKAIVPPKVTIQAPDWTDAFFQQLQAQVDAANAAIAQVYAKALADEQAEDDDIQALIALGVL